MTVNVLIIGSGGREHALAWKLKQSPRIGNLYVAPGNGGTEQIAQNVPIDISDIQALVRFASEKGIGLTVVGAEGPLAAGIVDYFRAQGLRIFGPTKAAAQIESSKIFAKHLMDIAHIPTAKYLTGATAEEALYNVRRMKAPYVIKADGLAAGKGVVICKTLDEAEAAIKGIVADETLDAAGRAIVIEEYVDGPEVSIHSLTDGRNFFSFPPSQDHKTIGEKDTGKNTGGMGAIAPLPWVPPESLVGIEQQTVRPVLEALAAQGMPFSGLLFPGIKLPVSGPVVLEYNARFGDPETQVYMRLLQSDLLDLLEACVDGGLTGTGVRWNWGFAATVVLASAGYPDAYETGKIIYGIRDAEHVDGVVVFHMSTAFEGDYRTTGGRVLGVSAIGGTLEDAIAKAYRAADKIEFDGKYMRRDIGASALR